MKMNESPLSRRPVGGRARLSSPRESSTGWGDPEDLDSTIVPNGCYTRESKSSQMWCLILLLTIAMLMSGRLFGEVRTESLDYCLVREGQKPVVGREHTSRYERKL